jgi:hypothetical protein
MKQETIYIAIFALIMFNLNPLVDHFFHSEIPYFDVEHLIVGGITGSVSMILFGLLLVRIRNLNKALEKIETLEKILPICSYCRKIRMEEENPRKPESWQSIESYLNNVSATRFSPAICPDCYDTHYPYFNGEKIN